MVKHQWYVRVGEKVSGPHRAGTIRRAAREGKVKPTTAVRKGNDGRWVEARRVRGLRFTPQAITMRVAAATDDSTRPDSENGHRGPQSDADESPCDRRPQESGRTGWKDEGMQTVYRVFREEDASSRPHDVSEAQHAPEGAPTGEVALQADNWNKHEGLFPKVYDLVMEFPYADIPLIGGNLFLAAVITLWVFVLPVCAVLDLVRFRNPFGLGNRA